MAAGLCMRCGEPKEPARLRRNLCQSCADKQGVLLKGMQQAQAARAAALVKERIASDPRLAVRPDLREDPPPLRECVRCGIPSTFECQTCGHAFCETGGCWLDGHPNKHTCVRNLTVSVA